MSIPPRTDRRPIKLFSIDDHEIVHGGVELLASLDADFEFVGASSDTASAVQDVVAADPDIVLLDLFIGEEQGWPVCRQLRETLTNTHVVFYTGYGSVQLVDRAIALGASGFILKSTRTSDLPDKLRAVMTVGQFIDPGLMTAWIASHQRRSDIPFFSEQERRIVALIADGLDNFEVAEAMHVSFHTVKFHIGKLLKRTGESNRAGLVRYAKEQFLLE
ncbi:hypothetical protein CH282_16185 [Rhodococcus sp. 06-418-1B]|nr:response regulator transcription factor [Rhodococcus sp. 06-418-1B]OZC83485.1 hypothetical protein CH282_16185 [Rhodococcus sp. 06-418-1B]